MKDQYYSQCIHNISCIEGRLAVNIIMPVSMIPHNTRTVLYDMQKMQTSGCLNQELVSMVISIPCGVLTMKSDT